MPMPNDLHIDQLMTDFAISYRNLEFIGDALFPTVPVEKESNKFAILDPKKDQQRVYDTLREVRTEARLVEWANATATYTCKEYSAKAGVDWRERDNADNPFDPDRAATQAALDAILIDRENRIATAATTAASFSATHKTTLAGANQWSDPTSNPRGDVDSAKDAVRKDVGKIINIAVMSFAVFTKVSLVTKVLDAIKYTQLGVATVDLISRYLGVEQIRIGMAVKNTANLGQAAVMADIWGKFAVLAYVEATAGLWGMTFGKTFQKGSFEVRTYTDLAKKTDFFEPDAMWDENLVAVDAGYLVSAAIA